MGVVSSSHRTVSIVKQAYKSMLLNKEEEDHVFFCKTNVKEGIKEDDDDNLIHSVIYFPNTVDAKAFLYFYNNHFPAVSLWSSFSNMASAQGGGANMLQFLSEENVMFLETAFWSFECNINELLSGSPCRSSQYPLKHTKDDLFYLEVETESASSINVHFRRNPIAVVNRPDNGYYIKVSILLVGSSSASLAKCMEWDTDDVFVTYNMDSLDSGLTSRGMYTVKCTTQMVETMSFVNENRNEQEKLLRENLIMNDGSLEDMASLLKREEVGDIFSGRQPYDFAIYKTALITRSLRYAKGLVKLQQLRQEGNQDGSWQLPFILGFIKYGELKEISQHDCLMLYMLGHNHGLEFLQTECAELMLKSLDNEYVLKCLMVATIADDKYLLDKALDYFLHHKPAIMNSRAWESMKVNNWQPLLCVVTAWMLKISNDGVEEEISG